MVPCESVSGPIEAPLTTNQEWGIGDADLEALVRRAELAYSVDAFDEISSAQKDMDRVLDAAEALGGERILWAKIGSGAGVLLAALLAAAAVRRVRRRVAVVADGDLARADVVLSV